MGTMFFKCFAEALKSHQEYNNLQNPLTYAFLVVALMLLFVQVKTFNKALRFYDQLEVVPIYQSSIIINGILCGSIILNEVRLYSPLGIGMIVVGAIICISGILLLLYKLETKTACQIGPFYR